MLGAEPLVEGDRRLVPGEDAPLEAAGVARDGELGEVAEERCAEATPARLGAWTKRSSR